LAHSGQLWSGFKMPRGEVHENRLSRGSRGVGINPLNFGGFHPLRSSQQDG